VILSQDLRNLVDQLEAESARLTPSQLRERIEILDRLDALFGDRNAPVFQIEPEHAAALPRAEALRAQLEALNVDLYRSIRTEIQCGTEPELLLQLAQESVASQTPAGGLSFDYLDELLSGVLALEEPDPPPAHPPDGMVFYQPTPARHIFRLLNLTVLTQADVLVDLGSGLGHVPLLAAICTGARCVGIEREEAYVSLARRCAQQLNLDRASFLQQDARQADLSRGTAFYLYTPFTGAILFDVLSKLQHESKSHPIRICTFGPCTEAIAKEPWLESDGQPDPDHITIFSTRRSVSA